ncbi:MAG: HNH endonuclease [Paludibacteraceae bacterium]|nr:HNH endonuclease [Paludibacteraceae bacterium]
MLKAKRKYVQDNYYPGLSFGYGGHNICLSLSKFLYAWFKGEVPEGYVVDHIDNNHFNNSISNLQLLTIKDNLAKRYTDNNCPCFNQFHNTAYDKDYDE